MGDGEGKGEEKERVREREGKMARGRPAASLFPPKEIATLGVSPQFFSPPPLYSPSVLSASLSLSLSPSLSPSLPLPLPLFLLSLSLVLHRCRDPLHPTDQSSPSYSKGRTGRENLKRGVPETLHGRHILELPTGCHRSRDPESGVDQSGASVESSG